MRGCVMAASLLTAHGNGNRITGQAGSRTRATVSTALPDEPAVAPNSMLIIGTDALAGVSGPPARRPRFASLPRTAFVLLQKQRYTTERILFGVTSLYVLRMATCQRP